MKSFKEYLIESKQTYDFKVKIAGSTPDDCAKKIKEALSQFDVSNCSSGTRTPIQETQIDFPEQKNIEVTVYEVCLNYPATSEQVRNLLAEKFNTSASNIKVRNEKEEEESELNHQNDEQTEEVLGKDYDKVNNQSIVGDKHTMSLLKELSKNKTKGEQYKGINDKLLAKKSPSEKATTVKTDKKAGTISPVGSKQNKVPSAKGL